LSVDLLAVIKMRHETEYGKEHRGASTEGMGKELLHQVEMTRPACIFARLAIGLLLGYLEEVIFIPHAQLISSPQRSLSLHQAHSPTKPIHCLRLEEEKGSSMIAAQEVWGIIQGYVPKRQWVTSEEISALVQMHGKLDAEDQLPHSAHSATPRWKVLVRRVMADRVKRGGIRTRKRRGG
jgi:hypothetical protein